MKKLRLILVSLVVLSGIIIFLFALFPSHVRISRIINISAAPGQIWPAICDLSNWPQWNVLAQKEGTNQVEFSSPSSGVGAFLGNSSVTVKITRIVSDSVFLTWTSKKGKRFEGAFTASKSSDNQTIVQWYFDFYVRWYPWEKLGLMYYDKQMGPLMEKSLLDLKSYVENR